MPSASRRAGSYRQQDGAQVEAASVSPSRAFAHLQVRRHKYNAASEKEDEEEPGRNQSGQLWVPPLPLRAGFRRLRSPGTLLAWVRLRLKGLLAHPSTLPLWGTNWETPARACQRWLHGWPQGQWSDNKHWHHPHALAWRDNSVVTQSSSRNSTR